MLRARLAAKTGFLHSQSKQPVLKIGLKSSVEGQTEMKSDKFGWWPKKAIIFWWLPQRPGSRRWCQLQMLPEQRRWSVRLGSTQHPGKFHKRLRKSFQTGQLTRGIHRVKTSSPRTTHLPRVGISAKKKKKKSPGLINVYTAYTF